jgi:DNA-binding NarL/FixJ family response regulator
VDDDADFRELVHTAFQRLSYEVREAESGEEALLAAAERRPDAVVIDIHLGGMNGYAVCRELRERYGEGIGIVFVSGERTESIDRVAGLLIGADDYLVKPFDPEELVARIRRLLKRNGSAADSPRSRNGAALTARELEVLRLLAAGLRPADIAGELVLSSKTVSAHIQHILAKLGVHTQAQAVATAYRERLVDHGSPGVASLAP